MQTRIPMSKEDVQKLQEHPYVLKATEWTVSFTPAFKKMAYEDYYGGKSMRQIFIDAGFDIEMLGDKRIENFRNKLLAKSKTNSDFEDLRKNNCRKEAQSTAAQMAKCIRELEHRNAYLEQENDFLKKFNRRKRLTVGKRAVRSDYGCKI